MRPGLGSKDDPRGFVIHPSPGLMLEDGTRHLDPILETHPRWTDDGWIRGEFALPALATDHRLHAAFGFIDPYGEPCTRGVTITIACDTTLLHHAPKLFTRHLDTVALDLTPFAGPPRILSIEVSVNGDATQTWLVWTVLQITPYRSRVSAPQTGSVQ
jgi:hypothetical protein